MENSCFIKSGNQEVQRPQNRLFLMVNSCFYQIRCLGGTEISKSAILDGKQLLISNQVLMRCTDRKIGYCK